MLAGVVSPWLVKTVMAGKDFDLGKAIGKLS